MTSIATALYDFVGLTFHFAIAATLIFSLIGIGWFILWKLFLSKYETVRVLLGQSSPRKKKENRVKTEEKKQD